MAVLARKLIRDEWDVRALRRCTPQNADRNNSISWIIGDALNAEQVETAASECSVIVHAVNPPGYRNWELGHEPQTPLNEAVHSTLVGLGCI